jgi:hypothetical protein
MNIYTSILKRHIAKYGPIKSIRVSSAQARGAAKKYSYWGAARYEIIITKNGNISNIAIERASSDRRSERLAHEDADKIAIKEGRIHCQTIGRLSDKEIKNILSELNSDYNLLL